LLFSYGNIIDKTVNENILALHRKINAKPFPGFIESVPAYASLAVFYDTVFIRQSHPGSAFEFVKEVIVNLSKENIAIHGNKENKVITIPVHYNGEDLAYVASLHRLTIEEVISLHANTTYHVYMTGFLPGFAYMGTVDEKIVTPRKDKPRLNVSAGSVGIAGEQTGIYPFDSPGGWQIIGATPLKIFDKEKEDPCLLKAGYTVQFTAIDKNDFEKLNEH
jgi:inhibitor of KinA